MIIISVICVLIISGTILYARFVSTSTLIVNEQKIKDNNLPNNFYGLKVVHFSDIHYGRTVKTKYLTNVINKINELKPDIVVFTGDLLDKDVALKNEDQRTITTLLSKIRPTLGKYAILGEHDDDNSQVILTNSDFMVMNNQFDLIYKDGYTPIMIGGVKSGSQGNVDELMNEFQALNNRDIKYKILLIHEPDYIDQTIKYHFNLVLAGHSHHGQIRLPFIGGIIKQKGAFKYTGLYYDFNNSKMYVSNGLGTASNNFRWFNTPSINLYRLVNK